MLGQRPPQSIAHPPPPDFSASANDRAHNTAVPLAVQHAPTSAVAGSAQHAHATSTSSAEALVSLASFSVLDQQAHVNSGGIPVGAVACPVPQPPPVLPVIRRPPICCQNCGAFLDKYAEVDSRAGRWTCNYCESSSACAVLTGLGPQSHQELLWEAVDYVEAAAAPQPQASGHEQDPFTPSVVLAVDATIDDDQLQVVRSSLGEVLQAMPGHTYVAIITFDSAVHLHNLSAQKHISAFTLPGHCSLTNRLVRQMFCSGSTIMAPINTCLETAQAIVQSVRPYQHFLPERERSRCLAVAIEAALSLLRGSDSSDTSAPAGSFAGNPAAAQAGRILVLTGGPITHGPGQVPLDDLDGEELPESQLARELATQYLERLARSADTAGIPIDIFAAGMAAPNVPLMSLLTQHSGGALMLQETFGTLLALNIRQALHRRQGIAGVIDVFTSPSLRVAQIIGPATPLDDTERAALSRQEAFLPSINACTMPTVEIGQGFGIVLEAQRDLEADHVLVQVVMRWVLGDGSRLRRVVTRRMSVVSSVSSYMRSISPITASVLLAKQLLLECEKQGVASHRAVREDAQLRVGKLMEHLAQRYGTCRQGSSTWFGLFSEPPQWEWPAHLAFMLHALYHLHRGTMLGVILGHSDERTVQLALYRQADKEMCDRMLTPRLYVLQPDTWSFQQLPASDLALDSGAVLVLDHGTHLFLWMGRTATSGPKGRTLVEDACKQLVGRLAAGRFPMPELRITFEGTGDARYVLSRLPPMHKDSPSEQAWQYPPAAGMASEQLRLVTDKLLPTDAPSLLQWARSFRVDVPPDADFVAVEAAAAALPSQLQAAAAAQPPPQPPLPLPQSPHRRGPSAAMLPPPLPPPSPGACGRAAAVSPLASAARTLRPPPLPPPRTMPVVPPPPPTAQQGAAPLAVGARVAPAQSR